jgi:hypothetical protein
MQLDIPELPKIDSYGCYDINKVLHYSTFVGEAQTAQLLKLPIHRIVFFKSKLKEPKRVNHSIHSLR